MARIPAKTLDNQDGIYTYTERDELGQVPYLNLT